MREDIAKYVNLNGKKFLAAEEAARERGRDNAHRIRERGRHPTASIEKIKRAIAVLQASVTFLVMFLVQGVGVVVALGAGIWLEIKATTNGFAWLDAANATGYATVSILLFVLLLFIRQSLDPVGSPRYKFSLKTLWKAVAYFGGSGKRERIVGSGINGVVRLWVYAIVLFGFIGRLNDLLIGLEDTPWRDAITAISEQATLPEFIGLFGNVFYTIALALGLHFVVAHIYTLFTALTGGVQAEDFFSEGGVADEDALVQIELEKLYKAILAQNSTE